MKRNWLSEVSLTVAIFFDDWSYRIGWLVRPLFYWVLLPWTALALLWVVVETGGVRKIASLFWCGNFSC